MGFGVPVIMFFRVKVSDISHGDMHFLPFVVPRRATFYVTIT